MIRFELTIQDPRASGSILRGNLQLTAESQTYTVPFDSEFQSDLSHLYQSVVAVIWQSGDHNGTFRDETEEIKEVHEWNLVRSKAGEILFQVFQLNHQQDQRNLVLEYRAPWLSFILEFSKITESNQGKRLWDILTAWNTLRKRNHEKPISTHAVLINVYPELCKLFKTVTYTLAISELCKAPYVNLIERQILRILQLTNKHVLVSVTPVTSNPSSDYLEIAWQLNNFSHSSRRIKIEWNNVDEFSASGEEIELRKNNSCLLTKPRSAFTCSTYADYAEAYRHYFAMNLHDSWFHQTQYWK